jgi:hypothetical protein
LAAVCAAVALSCATPVTAQGAPRVERFRIAVPDAVLADLDERLARTRWPDQLAGTGWGLGADTAYIRELADYWQRDFDWREQEERLNRFEHYRADIDGTLIHFVHAKSRDPNAVPICSPIRPRTACRTRRASTSSPHRCRVSAFRASRPRPASASPRAPR